MRIRATDEVEAAVRERGGRLYVWAHTRRCCTGPLVLLDTGYAPPAGAHRFSTHDAGGYQVLFDPGARRPPEELVLETRGRRRKVVAFWDDLAWVG